MAMDSINSISDGMNNEDSNSKNETVLPIKSCYDNLPINDSQYEKIFEYYDNHL